MSIQLTGPRTSLHYRHNFDLGRFRYVRSLRLFDVLFLRESEIGEEPAKWPQYVVYDQREMRQA